MVPKTHPAAKARFINFPPLTLLPSSLPSLLASPKVHALRGLLPAVLQEPFRRANRPEIEDESAYDFVARRFGDRFAREYLTAIVHGIYAADARSLSVRATFPFLWNAEDWGKGSVVRGFMKRMGASLLGAKVDPLSNYEVGGVEEKLKRASMYTFTGGIERLSSSVLDWLKLQPNVQILTDTTVERLEPRTDGIHVSVLLGNYPYS